MSGISVMVLTLNEQKDLPDCLRSVAWSDDIHVFDSFSTDSTLDIARRFGAHVIQRPFDNWAAHQNWGLRNIAFKHEWVFYIDADERVTPELAAAMQRAVADPGEAVAFRARRRDFLLGRWLKHSAPTPFYVRLFRPAHVHYERLVNPLTVVDGPVMTLDGHFDHLPFSKGVGHWVDRHNKYSTLEARQCLANEGQEIGFQPWKAVFESDLTRRRFQQKELVARMPFRPMIMFLGLYLLRRGFLDGRAGFTYAMLRAFYEYMIVLKIREMRDVEEAKTGPEAAPPVGTLGAEATRREP
jgi:glycosyltransferase involved in cell wall biosynthesis